MCWSAETSFLTLGLGSVGNALSFVWLRHRKSPVAAFVWAWQYALLMQLPEGVAWLQLRDGNADLRVVGRVAMLLNVTQPLALFAATRLSGLKGTLRYGHVALLMYLTLLASEAGELWRGSRSIAPSEECEHLDLNYWNTSRGILFVVTSLVVFSEVSDPYWKSVNTLLFLVSLLTSVFFYECGLGSMWCWIVSFSGPFLVIAEVVRPLLMPPATPSSTSSSSRPLPSRRPIQVGPAR